MERKGLRLKSFDYATSVGYFITICTQDKKCVLSRIVGTEQSPAPTISDIICELKSKTTKLANKEEGLVGRKIFQHSFYDSIIRDDEYQTISQYITQNPHHWQKDKYFTKEEP